MNKADFPRIIEEATKAGIEAGQAHKPTPMIVGQAKSLFSREMVPGTEELVPDGVCGFAWVVIRPATSSFVNYLRQRKIGRKRVYPGWIVSPYDLQADFNQSMERKEKWAEAVVKVLRSYGIRCYAESRMD